MLLSLTATALLAQEAPVARATEPVSAETDQDVNNPRAMRLTLRDALTTSLQSNLGVQVQQYEYRITGENLRAAYGPFDWIASGTAAISKNSTPGNPTSHDLSIGAGVSQFLPTGGDYSVGVSNSRSTVNGGINPQYGSGLDLAFNQPLLRDFGIDVNRRGIAIARNNLGISDEQFRTVTMDTVHATEQAYLDLVYARRNVDVVKESLFLARDQARITQIRIDVGASAPLDILQPRVTIATTEESLVSAVAAVRDAEDRLRALLNLPQADWDRPIIPTDDVGYAPLAINTEAAVREALANRPEIAQQRFATENLRVQALYTRNQTLPALDLNLTYGAAGVAGRRAEINSNGDPTGRVISEPFTDALTDVFRSDFPSWKVGVTFGIPILNIGARANARAAQLDLEESRLNQAQTEQNISVEVRSAARAVETYARTIAASRAARDAAERNLEAERRRFENGMTTNFQVLEVQQQLSDARVRELLALVGYNKAVAAYHRSVGDILQIHNIALADLPPVEEPKILPFLDRYNWLNYGNLGRLEETPK
ncbi:MAG: TolC family protein [Acidobacteria bacterium]|nr:TolC family protein [Acidobacteriota bacterium]